MVVYVVVVVIIIISVDGLRFKCEEIKENHIIHHFVWYINEKFLIGFVKRVISITRSVFYIIKKLIITVYTHKAYKSIQAIYDFTKNIHMNSNNYKMFCDQLKSKFPEINTPGYGQRK